MSLPSRLRRMSASKPIGSAWASRRMGWKWTSNSFFFERLAQTGFDVHGLADLLAHIPLKNLEPAAALGAGDVHGDGRVLQEFLGQIVVGGAEHHAHRRRGVDHASGDVEGFLDGFEDVSGCGHGFAGRGDLFEQDDEFVAAHSGGGVQAAQQVAQPVGHGFEELVAGGVAQGIVDHLEAVEIEIEHGVDVTRPPARPFEGLADAVETQRPIGQIGQGIVEGGEEEFFLGPFFFGDVVDDQGGAAFGRREDGRLDVAFPAEKKVFEAHLRTFVGRLFEHVDPKAGQLGQTREQVLADEFGAGNAGQAFKSGIDVDERQAGIAAAPVGDGFEQGKAGKHFFEQGAELFFRQFELLEGFVLDERDFNGGFEAFVVQRFDEVAEGVGFAGAAQGVFVGVGGEVDDRRVVLFVERKRRMHAVEFAGERDVHEHDVGLGFRDAQKRFFTRGGVSHKVVAQAFQAMAGVYADEFFIFDEKDGAWLHAGGVLWGLAPGSGLRCVAGNVVGHGGQGVPKKRFKIGQQTFDARGVAFASGDLQLEREVGGRLGGHGRTDAF